MSRRGLRNVKVLNIWISTKEHAFLKERAEVEATTLTEIVRRLIRQEIKAADWKPLQAPLREEKPTAPVVRLRAVGSKRSR